MITITSMENRLQGYMAKTQALVEKEDWGK